MICKPKKGGWKIKTFIKTPNMSSGFEKVAWCINLAQSFSEKPVSKETVLKSIDDLNIDLSEKEIQELLKLAKN